MSEVCPERLGPVGLQLFQWREVDKGGGKRALSFRFVGLGFGEGNCTVSALKKFCR